MKTVNETYESCDSLIHSKTEFTIKTECCENSWGIDECSTYFEIINKVPYLQTPPITNIIIDIDEDISNIQDLGEQFYYESDFAVDFHPN